MKHALLLITSLPLIAACSQLSDLASRSGADPELPGIPTTIDCNPQPTLIYGKTGQLLETVYPVLHPSCKEDGAVLGEAITNDRPWWALFGPPRNPVRVSSNLKDEDKPAAAAVVASLPAAAQPATFTTDENDTPLPTGQEAGIEAQSTPADTEDDQQNTNSAGGEDQTPAQDNVAETTKPAVSQNDAEDDKSEHAALVKRLDEVEKITDMARQELQDLRAVGAPAERVDRAEKEFEAAEQEEDDIRALAKAAE